MLKSLSSTIVSALTRCLPGRRPETSSPENGRTAPGDRRGRLGDARWRLVAEYANALNAGRSELIDPLLSEDVRYESQMVLSALRGKPAVMDYLSGKLATLARSPDARVTAVLSDYRSSPSIVVHQYGNPNCLLLFEFNGAGLISGIDLCMVPGPADATPVH